MSPTRKARFKRRFIGTRPWTRHSLVLMIAGTVYIFVGVVYIQTREGSNTWNSLFIARDWFSLDAWGIIWIILGLLSIISSKWPPVAEKWGYMALTSLAATWGTFYILGVIFGPNSIGTLAVGLLWWLVSFMWWAISGLVSPEEIKKQIARGNGRG
jgi:hypothetical protein